MTPVADEMCLKVQLLLIIRRLLESFDSVLTVEYFVLFRACSLPTPAMLWGVFILSLGWKPALRTTGSGVLAD